MTKTLTEQWRDGTLPDGAYYILVDKYEQNEPEIDVGVCYNSNFEWWIVKEVLAPVPDYGSLYNQNDGRTPVGLFTVLKLIKRDIERYQKIRHLTDLECGIKSQVVSLLKRRGWDLGKDELVSNSDELVQKMHILEKRLEIAKKCLEYILANYSGKCISDICNALKEMEGVK